MEIHTSPCKMCCNLYPHLTLSISPMQSPLLVNPLDGRCNHAFQAGVFLVQVHGLDVGMHPLLNLMQQMPALPPSAAVQISLPTLLYMHVPCAVFHLFFVCRHACSLVHDALVVHRFEVVCIACNLVTLCHFQCRHCKVPARLDVLFVGLPIFIQPATNLHFCGGGGELCTLPCNSIKSIYKFIQMHYTNLYNTIQINTNSCTCLYTQLCYCV